MIISISEYSRLVVIIECDPAVQGRDDLIVTCYFKNQHVHELTCFSLKLSHVFNIISIITCYALFLKSDWLAALLFLLK